MPAQHRSLARKGGVGHARDGLELGHQAGLKVHRLFRRVAPGCAQVQESHQDLIRIEPGIGASRVHHAPSQKGGAAHETQRDGQLAHDQGVPESRPLPSPCRSTVPQDIGHISARGDPRWNGAEQKPGSQSHHGQEHVDPRIRSDGRHQRQREEGRDDSAGAPHEWHGYRDGDQCQHHALRHQLACKAAASGAQGLAHAHLAGSSGGSRQEEVSDVGTGQEEDQRGDPAQEQADAPAFGPFLRGESQAGGHEDLYVLVDVGRLPETKRDSRHGGLSRVEAHPVPEPSEQKEPTRAPLTEGCRSVGQGSLHGGHPKLRRRAQGVHADEPLRCHAHDLVGSRTQRDGGPDRAPVPAEASHPKAVAQHRDGVGAGRHLVGWAEESSRAGWTPSTERYRPLDVLTHNRYHRFAAPHDEGAVEYRATPEKTRASVRMTRRRPGPVVPAWSVIVAPGDLDQPVRFYRRQSGRGT